MVFKIEDFPEPEAPTINPIWKSLGKLNSGTVNCVEPLNSKSKEEEHSFVISSSWTIDVKSKLIWYSPCVFCLITFAYLFLSLPIFYPTTPLPHRDGVDRIRYFTPASRIIMLRFCVCPSTWWFDQSHGLFGNWPLAFRHTVYSFLPRPRDEVLLSCGVRVKPQSKKPIGERALGLVAT